MAFLDRLAYFVFFPPPLPPPPLPPVVFDVVPEPGELFLMPAWLAPVFWAMFQSSLSVAPKPALPGPCS
jgi:hypothetical protein